ncbi:NAD-dependent DNA ligase [uncultured Selenomonas sp.]|uniref:NAD-dependent DNA ligase n=1 Tax=uncultured Selenomonas sp. TaxID=159275 RepID=UPI0028EA5EA2|nr:NAD-dependent DNA ligase [uncultured Selenomonas sp.]
MREQNEVTAELVDTLRRLVDVLEEIAQSSQSEEQAKVSKLEEASPTLEEVRTVLAKLSVEGHSAAVKSLIAKFGADKLSELAPEHYAALLKEAEKIGT